MYGMQNKRGRTESGTKSTQQEVDSQNAIVHYDANIAISVSSDLGVDDSLGYHGRFANFKETRTTALLPETELYKVAVVRASVTTNNIPLFCPVPSGTGPILENGDEKWEVTAQPGLNMTWTGPVFENTESGFDPQVTNQVASWPYQGLIPFYTALTTPPDFSAGPADYPKQGVMDCSTFGKAADCVISSANTGLTYPIVQGGASDANSLTLTMSVPVGYNYIVGHTVNVSITVPSVITGVFKVIAWLPGSSGLFLTKISGTTYTAFGAVAMTGTVSVGVSSLVDRLNSLFVGAGLTLYATVSNPGAINMSQFIQITNSSTQYTAFLDFSLPTAATTLNYASNTYTSRAGILQACKLLGFAPNSIASIGPGATFTCPRAFQMGFRATVQLASYKTVRWVPEDAFNVTQGYTPSVSDIFNGTTRTYFDCYSYEHFLNQCVNPTFQRIIYDENDASVTTPYTIVSGSAPDANSLTLQLSNLAGYNFSIGQNVNVSISSPAVITGVFEVTSWSSLASLLSLSKVSGPAFSAFPPPPVVPVAVTGTVVVAGTPFENQCLTRQLQAICTANCKSIAFSPSVSVGPSQGVSYNGRAFMWIGQTLEVGVIPTTEPPNVASLQSFWQDCGASILQSYNPTLLYSSGDVITFQDPSGIFGTGIPGASCTFLYVSSTPSTGVAPSTAASTPWFFIDSNERLASEGRDPAVPTVGTAAPFITYNSSSQLFTLNLDSYGFGGTESTNADDGFLTSTGSPNTAQSTLQQAYNCSLNDQARDSWGLTGTAYVTTPAYTTYRHPGVVFDERMIVECDDYFHQLFGNWPCQRLFYDDPNFNGRITSYVRYLPQVNNAGLSVPLPLPVFTPSTPSSSAYQPYERVKGNQPYLYTFTQDYSSVGGMWNPVDTFVFLTNDIPLIKDQTAPPNIVSDTGPVALQQPNGAMERILCEFSVQPMGNGHPGQQYRNEVIYEPTTPVFVGMDSAPLFVTVSWRLVMRMKQSQTYRSVSISDGGSVNMRLQFRLRGM
jgi:hypothetical protein